MKNNLKPLLALAAAAALLFSCKNEPKKTDGTAASPAAGQTAAAKPEVEIYVADVSALRLRETPEANGKVITNLEKGSLLTATGKRSDQKVTLPFGPGDETDYMIEVKAGDKTGWVFKPAVLKAYCGSTADVPGEGFAKFALELGKLPLNKLESGGQAYNLLKTMMPKGGDAAFVLMERMLRQMQFDPKISGMFENPALQAKFEAVGETVWQHTFDHSKFPETKKAYANGFKLTTAEGFFFPTTDYRQLKAAFAGSLSPATASWLDQTIVEDLEPTAHDGGLAIEQAELIERAIFWENWLEKNPYHVYSDEVAESAKWLRNDLLIGMDNTPTMDYETKKLLPEAEKAWATILKDFPNSKLAVGVKQMQSLIAADGGVRGPKTEAFVQKLIEMEGN